MNALSRFIALAFLLPFIVGARVYVFCNVDKTCFKHLQSIASSNFLCAFLVCHLFCSYHLNSFALRM